MAVTRITALAQPSSVFQGLFQLSQVQNSLNLHVYLHTDLNPVRRSVDDSDGSHVISACIIARYLGQEHEKGFYLRPRIARLIMIVRKQTVP